MLNKLTNFFKSYQITQPLQTFSDISKERTKLKKRLVNSTLLAFDFDTIAKKITTARNDHKTVDAIYIDENGIELIEFKQGMISRSKGESQRTAKNIRNEVSEKLSSSLHLVEKIVLPNIMCDSNALHIRAVIVYDTYDQDGGTKSIVSRLADRSGTCDESLRSSFSHFVCKGKINGNEKRIFYDDLRIVDNEKFDLLYK